MPSNFPGVGPTIRRWPGRAACAAACVGLPALVLAVLAALWVRDRVGAEGFVVEHSTVVEDPATGGVVRHRLGFRVEACGGVLGCTATRERQDHPGGHRPMTLRFASLRAEAGWRWGVDHAPLRPFGLDPAEVDVAHTLFWDGSSWGDWRLVAPIWAWMLPPLVPIGWWRICPSGRVVPRWTVGRALAATAAVALVLGALLEAERPSAAERARAVVAQSGGRWTFGPDPSGSGRRVVLRVVVGPEEGPADPVDLGPADASRLRGALAEFPGLRSLVIRPGAGASGVDLAAWVAGHPHLKDLDLGRTRADDATMAAVGACRDLRWLNLDGTRVTDAGLAHLAGHPTLEGLRVDDLDLSDAGLARLRGLPRLRMLLHRDGPFALPGLKCRITDAGLDELGRTLPNLELLTAGSRRVEPPDGRRTASPPPRP